MNFTNKPHWVNAFQTKEERKEKYWLARSCGASAALADRMRDWLLPKIERYFGLERKQTVTMRPDGVLQINSEAE